MQKLFDMFEILIYQSYKFINDLTHRGAIELFSRFIYTVPFL